VIPPALTQSLSDRYRVDRELGRGGMATVYLALDLKHARQVAIKVMLPELAAAIGHDRFLREIEIAARLSHPHILPLFDSGTADGLIFYVMPYVEGESLRARLTREKMLPVEEALRLAREVASALGYAHQMGFVHRDIKPENVLLSRGVALVADFGIARAVWKEMVTTAGTVMGTPAYMSPEQAVGSADVDARSDLYSLGCVLYEMLTGQPPFVGPSESLVHQHLSVAPRPVTELRPGVPRGLTEAVAKALAKVRADRFADAAAFAAALTVPARAARPRSVAVLPFQNLSADPDNEYFADGMTEDVIAQLSKVRTLTVISRSSVMPFKKRDQRLREVGEKLEVATLFEGSVRRIGDRVRIVGELVDAETEEILWAETYDRQLTDVFVIQTDVALQIAAALRAELSPGERARIGRQPTHDLQAYQLYLQGRHCLIRYTVEEMRRSIEFFEQALERDPGYAQAYVGIAMACTELAEIGALGRDHAHRRAKSAAMRALELDGELGDAHCTLAHDKMVHEFDWKGAETEFKRALELSPNSADTHDLYGRLCSALERYDEAIALQERAYELDPLAHKVDVATALVRAGRYQEAAQAATRAIQLDPHYDRAHATLGWALLKAGRTDEGLAELERAVSLTPADNIWLAQLGQAYARAGRADRAREVLRRLEDPARNVSPYHLAYVHAGLGEADRAMDFLERAFEQRTGAVYGIKGSFLFEPLREHPRFIALLRKMNLA
jgi:eukaryotic-like serine/threonine-protein kinase